MPRSTNSLPLSQSTSDHFKARHSLMRCPKQQHSRAIARNGSTRWCANIWNSSTVRLRGMRTRFDVPLILTSSIGLRLSLAISPLHAAKSQRFRSTPLMCVLLFGASDRDSSHNSTGRGSRSVIAHPPHFGRMWFLIQTSYDRFVSVRVGILSVRYCSTSVKTVGAVGAGGAVVVGEGSACATRHAAPLVGNSCLVPMTLLFRLPSTHCKKFHVP